MIKWIIIGAVVFALFCSLVMVFIILNDSVEAEEPEEFEIYGNELEKWSKRR